MSDSAICVVKTHATDAEVYLYTHDGGTNLLRDVQRALRRRARWNDPSYLTRMIFDEMTAGRQGSETGAGIDVRAGDNECGRPYVVVDVPRLEVRLEDPVERNVVRRWTFYQFCKADLRRTIPGV